MKQRGYIFLKVVLPLIYILIFLPQLNNQIAPNNHNLIITLTTIENWMDEGALHHNFNLVHSWGNEGDKNVCYYKRVMNEEGRNYFVSYPPFATILIYPFLQMFPKEYLPFGFKLFGMILHLLTYLALLVLFRERSEFQRLFGAAVFLFFPASIVLSGMYYPEQLILFLAVLLAFVIQDKKSPVLIGILSFLLIYTDWLGALIIGSLLLMRLLKKGKIPLDYLLIGGLSGGLILIFQYSLIDGLDGLIRGLKIRYLERSGIFPQEYSDRGVNLFSSESFLFLKHHFLHASGVALGIILLLKPKFKQTNVLFWVLILPIGIHLILLFNSNILHYQNLSKVGLLLAVIGSTITKEGKLSWTIAPIIILYAYLSCLSYWEDYAIDQSLSEEAAFIKAKNDPNKVMVIEQNGFGENLVILSYLTKRNLVWSSSIEGAQKILESSNQKEFLLFNLKGRSITSGLALNP